MLLTVFSTDGISPSGGDHTADDYDAADFRLDVIAPGGQAYNKIRVVDLKIVASAADWGTTDAETVVYLMIYDMGITNTYVTSGDDSHVTMYPIVCMLHTKDQPIHYAPTIKIPEFRSGTLRFKLMKYTPSDPSFGPLDSDTEFTGYSVMLELTQ